MKLNTTTLVLGLSLAVVAGLFSATAIFGTEFINKQQTATTTSGLITGHVTTVHKDSAGNILEYRQTDNQIMNQGENCALKLLFQPTTGAAGSTVCTGANSKGFTFIQIGNSTMTTSPIQFKLGNPHNSTSFGATSALLISGATPNWNGNNTSSTTGTSASIQLSKTFTNGATNSQTVSESGLFNDTADSTNAMFARQTFTAITLSTNDQLTVTWTINIGGTSSINN